MNRETKRNLAKQPKEVLIDQIDLLTKQRDGYRAVAIKAEEDSIQHTKNALAMTIQNMTPIAMKVLREQYNFTESEAKKFESEFFLEFKDYLDTLGMEEQGENIPTEPVTAKSKIILP